MDSYSGFPSDQCLTEVLDYWLRHHAETIKWTEVADALKAVKLIQNQLAEKAQLLSSSAQKFNGIATNFLQESRSTQSTAYSTVNTVEYVR